MVLEMKVIYNCRVPQISSSDCSGRNLLAVVFLETGKSDECIKNVKTIVEATMYIHVQTIRSPSWAYICKCDLVCCGTL